MRGRRIFCAAISTNFLGRGGTLSPFSNKVSESIYKSAERGRFIKRLMRPIDDGGVFFGQLSNGTTHRTNPCAGRRSDWGRNPSFTGPSFRDKYRLKDSDGSTPKLTTSTMSRSYFDQSLTIGIKLTLGHSFIPSFHAFGENLKDHSPLVAHVWTQQAVKEALLMFSSRCWATSKSKTQTELNALKITAR